MENVRDGQQSRRKQFSLMILMNCVINPALFGGTGTSWADIFILAIKAKRPGVSSTGEEE